MASVLGQMLVPAQPIKAQAVESNQAPQVADPQGSNTFGNIMNAVGTAGQIAAMFL